MDQQSVVANSFASSSAKGLKSSLQDDVEPVLDGETVRSHCGAGILPAETVLALLSHHVRTGATVTMGFVELLERTLDAEELDCPRFEDNCHGGPRTLRNVLDRIQRSQERMVLAVEKMERAV